MPCMDLFLFIKPADQDVSLSCHVPCHDDNWTNLLKLYAGVSSNSLCLEDDLEFLMLMPLPPKWNTMPSLFSAGIEHRTSGVSWYANVHVKMWAPYLFSVYHFLKSSSINHESAHQRQGILCDCGLGNVFLLPSKRIAT